MALRNMERPTAPAIRKFIHHTGRNPTYMSAMRTILHALLHAHACPRLTPRAVHVSLRTQREPERQLNLSDNIEKRHQP